MRAFVDDDPRGDPRPAAARRRVADWGRLRYTMDEGSAKAVRVAFERLYATDLAYRTEALVNWCPGCRTSVSDLEVVADARDRARSGRSATTCIDEATGEPDPDATITVATTRPETILGDTAVAVHPDDARYAALVGRRVRIPFVERDVPIIADEVVDPAFGTGAVKITPGPRPRRPRDRAAPRPRRDPRSSPTTRRSPSTGHAYDGLDRYVARERRSWPTSRRAATSSGERPHEMVIGRCQRSGDVVEPRLKTQWFVRTGPLAARALEATRSGRTRILPDGSRRHGSTG